MEKVINITFLTSYEAVIFYFQIHIPFLTSQWRCLFDWRSTGWVGGYCPHTYTSSYQRTHVTKGKLSSAHFRPFPFVRLFSARRTFVVSANSLIISQAWKFCSKFANRIVETKKWFWVWQNLFLKEICFVQY